MRTALALVALLWPGFAVAADARPNIVYVLCDDLGYGDLKCLNPAGQIVTPNFDRLAKEGMVFTDMHSGSSVCSPTRYGIMTGRYSWRTKLQQFVLGGLSPRLIEPGRFTVASLLQQQGYHTACIGKWHLGMDWTKQPGKQVAELNIETPAQVWNVDYAQPIAGGPNSVGFDYYFGISASLDMVPYTYIENDRVTVVPTVDKIFPLMLGRPMGQTRKGPAAPEFDVADVLPELTNKALAYIDQRAADAKAGRPFFLYLPLASPHTPIAPTSPWQGKSGLNHYADFVMQTDAAIGQLLATLLGWLERAAARTRRHEQSTGRAVVRSGQRHRREAERAGPPPGGGRTTHGPVGEVRRRWAQHRRQASEERRGSRDSKVGFVVPALAGITA